MCICNIAQILRSRHYLAHHQAHEAEDPHGHVSGRPHEEVDDVGEEGRVQAVDGLHPGQQAVSDGLGHQDDAHDEAGHQVAPHVLPKLVLGQPGDDGEEAQQRGASPGHGARHLLLDAGLEDGERGLGTADAALQELWRGVREAEGLRLHGGPGERRGRQRWGEGGGRVEARALSSAPPVWVGAERQTEVTNNRELQPCFSYMPSIFLLRFLMNNYGE